MMVTPLNSLNALLEATIGYAMTVLIVLPRESAERQELLEEVAEYVEPDQCVIVILESDPLFRELPSPTELPAIGVWSAKGAFVGYRDVGEGLADFYRDARRFT